MTEDKETKALHLRDIYMSYGDNTVLHGVDLDVEHGETFGLIGLNGVGKTTLIKAILGLRDVDSGHIDIGGFARNKLESKKHIAYLPERFEPPWFLKGLEFIEFSMDLYDVAFDRERVFSLSEKVGLDPAVLSNRVQTYSKGMRQKLGIMSTLLSDCALMILDEPMSGLDPRARTLVKDGLTETRKRGKTIFLCSHILADMNEICDRVAVLNGGKFIYVGSPDGLKEMGGSDNLERAFLGALDQVPAAA